jgi:hypothetical protein
VGHIEFFEIFDYLKETTTVEVFRASPPEPGRCRVRAQFVLGLDVAAPSPALALLPAQLDELNRKPQERDDERRDSEDQNHNSLCIHSFTSFPTAKAVDEGVARMTR